MSRIHLKLMDQGAFVFATRGRCIKGKQWQHIIIQNQNMSLCSKQSSLFSFYALPSGGKSKGAAVHWKEEIKSAMINRWESGCSLPS